MGIDLRPTLMLDVGPPPWADIVGQRSVKHATLGFAMVHSHPWVAGLVVRMRATMAGDPLIDLRYWPHLEPGDMCGIPDWHRDCYDGADDPRAVGADHRLYFAGAGCRPMFRADYQPPEGVVLGYARQEHRIMPATVAGPRLLVRLSVSQIRPSNRLVTPTHYRDRRGA